MKEYKVTSEDTKNFSLSINDQEIGRLNYEKLFSFNAEVILNGTRTYQIQPKGYWGTTIEVKQNEKVLLNFKTNWNGSIIMKTSFDETQRDFILKHEGILRNTYILSNIEKEEELLVIRPDFKWGKFNYDYNISTTDYFDNLSSNIILLFSTIHCVNYYTVMLSLGTSQ